MLAQYETLTLALLQAPSSPVPLIPSTRLDTYINEARQQVAGQGLCVRQYVTLVMTVGQRQYNFSSVTGLATGISGIFNIRQIWVIAGSGQKWLPSRPFEYFSLYAFNNAAPKNGPPGYWAQFGQGTSGNFFFDPPPDGPYTLKLDVTAVPVDLTDDSTTEIIPPIWTLAVPFYAAWLGFQSLQRSADADKMLERFTQQMGLARRAADPNLITENWSQSPDMMEAGRLGVTQARPG